MKDRKPYKLPTIVRAGNGKWFVKYFYEFPDQPGVFKEFRVKDGVNYEHDPEQKEIEIQALCEDLTWALEHDNFNPFLYASDVKRQVRKVKEEIEEEFNKDNAQPVNWTLEQGIKAFEDYCKWKELSANTVRSYQTYINNFVEWLTETGQLQQPAYEYLETDFIKFVDSYYDAEDWSPRTYNNHFAFLITLFSRMQTLERKRSAACNTTST